MNRLRPTLLAALLLVATGCGGDDSEAGWRPTGPAGTGVPQGAQQQPAVHYHPPPHGGLLVHFVPDAATVEVVVDPAQGRIDLYLFGPHLRQYALCRQERIVLRMVVGPESFTFEAKAQANPLTGEVVGNTAHFSGRDERLIGVERFDAMFEKVQMLGQTFEEHRFSWPAETAD